MRSPIFSSIPKGRMIICFSQWYLIELYCSWIKWPVGSHCCPTPSRAVPKVLRNATLQQGAATSTNEGKLPKESILWFHSVSTCFTRWIYFRTNRRISIDWTSQPLLQKLVFRAQPTLSILPPLRISLSLCFEFRRGVISQLKRWCDILFRTAISNF